MPSFATRRDRDDSGNFPGDDFTVARYSERSNFRSDSRARKMCELRHWFSTTIICLFDMELEKSQSRFLRARHV